MPTVGLFNKEGNKIEDIQLNETIFAAEVNADAMHQVVVALLANKRQGTQSAKTRAEVEEAELSLGDKRELVELDKVQSEHHNGSKVELYSHQSQEITECLYQSQ